MRLTDLLASRVQHLAGRERVVVPGVNEEGRRRDVVTCSSARARRLVRPSYRISRTPHVHRTGGSQFKLAIARCHRYTSFLLQSAPRLIGLPCQTHEHVHDPRVLVCRWVEEEPIINEADDGGHCASLLSGRRADDCNGPELGFSTVLPAYLWPTVILLTSAIFAHFNASPWTRKIIYPDWILCAFVGLIIPLFRNLSAKGMVGQIASKVAKYSYGIYLSHMPLLWLTLVRFRGLPIGLRWVWFFAMMLIVPVLAYHLVEQPLIKIGKRFTAPRLEGTETRSERSARREFMQEPVPYAI
jgi:hypothetical protein